MIDEDVKFKIKGELYTVSHTHGDVNMDHDEMLIRIYTSRGAVANIYIYGNKSRYGIKNTGSAIRLELESGEEFFKEPIKRVENFKKAVLFLFSEGILAYDKHKKEYLEKISKMLENLDGRRVYEFVVKEKLSEGKNRLIDGIDDMLPLDTNYPIRLLGFYSHNRHKYGYERKTWNEIEELDQRNQTAIYMLDDSWRENSRYMLNHPQKFMIADKKEVKNEQKTAPKEDPKPLQKSAPEPVQEVDPRVAYIREKLGLADSVSDEIIKQAIDSILSEELNKSGKRK